MANPVPLKSQALLEQIKKDYGIKPDYDHTSPNDRFVGILEAIIEGEPNAAASFRTMAEAAEWFADFWGADHPREPVTLIDVTTGQAFAPKERREYEFVTDEWHYELGWRITPNRSDAT